MHQHQLSRHMIWSKEVVSAECILFITWAHALSIPDTSFDTAVAASILVRGTTGSFPVALDAIGATTLCLGTSRAQHGCARQATSQPENWELQASTRAGQNKQASPQGNKRLAGDFPSRRMLTMRQTSGLVAIYWGRRSRGIKTIYA